MMRVTLILVPLLFAAVYPASIGATAFISNKFSDFRNIPFRQESQTRSIVSSKVTGGRLVIRKPPCLSLAAGDNLEVETTKSRKPRPPAGKGEPWYWLDEDHGNDFLVTYDQENHQREDQSVEEECPKKDKDKQISKLRFKIRGTPRPLQRHRTSRGHVYNPSLKYQKSFLDAFEKLMLDNHGENIETPFFNGTEHLAMTIIFRMKRPKSHFVNNKPGPDRLKKKAPSHLSTIRTDVDNLTKFVLDSMNGIIYEDDRQITSIQATKLLDDDGLCSGSIEVWVRSINEHDLEEILR